MERITVTVTSDLFDEANQEASLRTNISVRTLIGEIQKEFALPDAIYSVRQQGVAKPLDLDKTLDQLGIKSGAQLIFSRERRSQVRAASDGRDPNKRPLSGLRHASLRLEPGGQSFDIEWQPAIIGRPDANNPASAAALAVDLGNHPESRSVSRQHAAITERHGNYLIESLQAANLVRLNDEEIELGERRRLNHGDKLTVGKVMLSFHIRESDGASG
jgi:hypothetical protein